MEKGWVVKAEAIEGRKVGYVTVDALAGGSGGGGARIAKLRSPTVSGALILGSPQEKQETLTQLIMLGWAKRWRLSVVAVEEVDGEWRQVQEPEALGWVIKVVNVTNGRYRYAVAESFCNKNIGDSGCQKVGDALMFASRVDAETALPQVLSSFMWRPSVVGIKEVAGEWQEVYPHDGLDEVPNSAKEFELLRKGERILGARTARLVVRVPGYEVLEDVLQEAYEQAACGKGKKCHADSEPFQEQEIMQNARAVGIGFPAGQARKKIREAVRCHTENPERAIEDLLGAINYAAATILFVRERQRDKNKFKIEPVMGTDPERLVHTIDFSQAESRVSDILGKAEPEPVVHKAAQMDLSDTLEVVAAECPHCVVGSPPWLEGMVGSIQAYATCKSCGAKVAVDIVGNTVSVSGEERHCG